MSAPPPPHAPPSPPAHIGVFDSGIGGLSVLGAVRRLLPGAVTSYLADAAHAPWGDRSADWVTARCQDMAAHLIGHGAQLVLVACNTATTQAISALRARWPGVPFVGVEPGVKPAVAATRNGRVAVIGTTGTLRSERLQRLVADHAADVQLLRLPCPGLVDAIERSTGGDDPALAGQLDHIARRLREADVDTVVLGCTHYPLVADALASRLGAGVTLLDTGDAVARRVASQLPPAALAAAQHAAVPGALQLWTTGDATALAAAARRWLPHPAHSHHLHLPPMIASLRE